MLHIGDSAVKRSAAVLADAEPVRHADAGRDERIGVGASRRAENLDEAAAELVEDQVREPHAVRGDDVAGLGEQGDLGRGVELAHADRHIAAISKGAGKLGLVQQAPPWRILPRDQDALGRAGRQRARVEQAAHHGDRRLVGHQQRVGVGLHLVGEERDTPGEPPDPVATRKSELGAGKPIPPANPVE